MRPTLFNETVHTSNMSPNMCMHILRHTCLRMCACFPAETHVAAHLRSANQKTEFRQWRQNINAHRFCCCKCAAGAKVLRHMSSDMSHNISLDMSLVWKHFNVIPWLFCFVHGQDTQYTRRLDAHLNHSQSGCYLDTNSAVLEILIQYWYRQPVSHIVS